jgi:hypothetical protein
LSPCADAGRAARRKEILLLAKDEPLVLPPDTAPTSRHGLSMHAPYKLSDRLELQVKKRRQKDVKERKTLLLV